MERKPRPTDIDPRTGKRYDYVPPEKRGREEELAQAEIDKQIMLLERQRKIMRARFNLIEFTEFTNPHPETPNDVKTSAYEAQHFHREIGKVLDDLLEGKLVNSDGSVCSQLIFCMPPRHGKTQLATKSLAAYYLGRNPSHQVAVGAYSDTLAQEFGSDTRAIINSPAYRQVFSDVRLRRGGNAKDNMETDKGGRAFFVGRGGAMTGRGAHALLIDDIFKDHEEARSQAIRDQAWNWFTKVAMTRRMGRKIVIITMTRWHSDDIIGRITDPENPCYDAIEAKKWKIIRLPAIAEEDDPLGRVEGEPLWPERFELEFLQSQQRLDPLGFASLYQQRPTVADGVLFRRETFQFYKPEELPENLRVYAASDHAVATGQRNDYTVLVTVGVDQQDNIWVLDCWWQKRPTDAVVEAMLQMARSRKPLVWWAEKGHISKSIGPFLHKRMQEERSYFHVQEVTPIGDKAQRAQSIAARVAMGKVFFPKNAVWTEKAVNELLAFPNGIHDDFSDAIAYIGLGLDKTIRASKPPEKKSPPAFGTLGWVKWTDKWQQQQDERRAAGGF